MLLVLDRFHDGSLVTIFWKWKPKSGHIHTLQLPELQPRKSRWAGKRGAQIIFLRWNWMHTIAHLEGDFIFSGVKCQQTVWSQFSTRKSCWRRNGTSSQYDRTSWCSFNTYICLIEENSVHMEVSGMHFPIYDDHGNNFSYRGGEESWQTSSFWVSWRLSVGLKMWRKHCMKGIHQNDEKQSKQEANKSIKTIVSQ